LSGARDGPRLRGRVLRIRALLVAAAAPLVACSLDFDRYDPAGAGSIADASVDASAGDSAPSSDASPDAAPGDGGADAEGDVDGGGGPCEAVPGCLDQASTCGTACGVDHQACAQDCDAQLCTDMCMSAEQSCLGRCLSSCIACASDAGCPAETQCLDSAVP
jgi:hypothetical protein